MHIYPQRELLQGSEGHIFNLVSYDATQEQWAEWLRVPLEHAAARGNVDLVTSLLNAGAGVEAGWRGSRGRTLLDAAALGGNADMVSALLRTEEARADVGVVSVSSGRSALYTAAKCGHEAAAQRLIVAGADVNFRDPIDDCGPLLRAVLDGHEQLAKELLNAGACPNMRGDGQRGWAPLHVAASCGQQGGVLSALLASGADKDALDDRGASPLHHAIARGQIDSVRKLLAAGADITTGGSFPALMLAASKGHALILRALLDYGADVNFRSPTVGRTALHAACCSSSHAIHMLVDAGGGVDAQRFDGGTPLHYAAASSSHEAITALVRCAADVNAQHSITDQTPLHVACQHQASGVDSAVDLLLRLGATETAIGRDGRTAFDLLGLQIADDGGRCSDDEKQRARTLLVRAKQDRAWRRRCWPVVLRSRALKASQQLSLSNNNGSQISEIVGTARQEEVPFGPHPLVGDIMAMAGEESSTAEEIRNDGRTTGAIVDLGSARNDRGTGSRVGERRPTSVMATLVGLQSDGVFRTVVGFL